MQEKKLRRPVTETYAWKHMKLKSHDLSEPQPSLPEYFSDAGEKLDKYCTVFKGFHPEVDDPLEKETDEVAVMVAGQDMEHGRTKILSSVICPTRTLTQIKSTLLADHPPYRASIIASRDVSFFINVLFPTFVHEYG
jgi:hypothetical protein